MHRALPELHVDDARIHYEIHGTQGPFVLFLHGALASGQAFRGQLPSLREDHRVVLVDQRGHGRSSHFGAPGGPAWETLRYETFVADALALADFLSPHDPVSLVGVSMGGVVAARLAEKHAARVDALALISTPSGPDPRRERFFATTTPDDLPDRTKRLSSLWHGAPYWRDLATHLFAYISTVSPDVYAHAPRPKRALVIQSEHDELLDPEDGARWAARFDPPATYMRAPGDHAFFADGRAGTLAANSALRELLAVPKP